MTKQAHYNNIKNILHKVFKCYTLNPLYTADGKIMGDIKMSMCVSIFQLLLQNWTFPLIRPVSVHGKKFDILMLA